MKEAKILRVFNKKNKDINQDTTLEIITQKSMMPFEYNGEL